MRSVLSELAQVLKTRYAMRSRKVLTTVDGESNHQLEAYPLQKATVTDFVEPGSPGQVTVTATYVGVFLFCAVYFFRPEDLIPGMAQAPFAKVAGVITGVALVAGLLAKTMPFLPEMKLFLAFFAYMCVAVPFSMYVHGSLDMVNSFSRPALIIVAAMCATTTVARLRYLILVQVFAMLNLAILARGQSLQGGRMFGFGPMFGDPNDMALNFCIILPFCVGFLLLSRFWLWKVFWTALIGVFVLTIFATYSRGGFIALLAVSVAMIRRFNVRTRTVVALTLIIVALFTVAILKVGPDSYLNRLRTITDPQADTTGSAQARQRLLIRSLEETVRHPLFGDGPGQFYLVAGDWHQSHNTYTELTSECGIPCLILFLMLVRRTFKNARMLDSLQRHDEPWYLAQALRCAMVAYLVGGFFLGTTYWLTPYLLLAYSVALRRTKPESDQTLPEPNVETAWQSG